MLLLMTAEVGPVRVTLDSDKTVDQLKKIIAKELEIPMEKQELYSAGASSFAEINALRRRPDFKKLFKTIRVVRRSEKLKMILFLENL